MTTNMTTTSTIAIRHETHADIAAREALLDTAMGEARFTKASERLREDSAPARGLSFVAMEDRRVVGTVRLWPVTAGGGRSALLLGPLAVSEDVRGHGIGGALMKAAIKAARKAGAGAIILVGDAPYYARFGFSAEKTGDLWMPGPCDPARLLALELRPGALDGASGLIASDRRHLRPAARPTQPAMLPQAA